MHIGQLRQRGPQVGTQESRCPALGLARPRVISPLSFSAFLSSQDALWRTQYLGMLWGTQFRSASFLANSIGGEG